MILTLWMSKCFLLLPRECSSWLKEADGLPEVSSTLFPALGRGWQAWPFSGTFLLHTQNHESQYSFTLSTPATPKFCKRCILLLGQRWSKPVAVCFILNSVTDKYFSVQCVFLIRSWRPIKILFSGCVDPLGLVALISANMALKVS